MNALPVLVLIIKYIQQNAAITARTPDPIINPMAAATLTTPASAV